MKIDLTDSASMTILNVKKLIESKDDSRNRQLRVSLRGEAYLSDKVGNQDLDDVKFRFETWGMGNDYCGKKAASSKEWVNRVHVALKDNWKNNTSGYIDFM